MSARTFLKLANGRHIDLRHPSPADYGDLAWVAEHLAKEKRFNGATSGIEYSVAQHVAEGVSAILSETGDETLAAYFSLHDCPESVLKDDTTPKKNAIAEIAQERFGVLADAVLGAFNELTDLHDAAIHQAAGLAWPPPTPRMVSQVKYWDLRMFVTEWRDLMGSAEHPDWDRYKNVVPLAKRIVPHRNWQESAEVLLVLWHRLLPVYAQRKVTALAAGRGAE